MRTACTLVSLVVIFLRLVTWTTAAEIDLEWDDPNNLEAVGSYTVYFWEPLWEMPAWETAGLNLTHTLSALAPGKVYEFAVTAVDPTGILESEYSNIVTATLPYATFSGTPMSGMAALSVTFTNQSTGNIPSSFWDFGDQTTSLEQHPVHTYTSPGTYTVRLIVTGPEGRDTAEAFDMIIVTEETSLTQMHVGDIDGANTNKGKTWTATAIITVHDTAHGMTADAEVSGSWSGGYNGAGMCITNSSGQCSILSGNMRKKEKHAVFTVTKVTHATLSYQAAANHDPDGDSNGENITIFKP